MATGGETDETFIPGPLQNIEEDNVPSEDTSAEEDKTLRILVIGETGAGKSTLVNSLIGKSIVKKPKVSHGPKATQHESVTKYTGNIGGVNVIVYDTRGLVDGDPKSNDKKLLKNFREVIRDDQIDLIFICHPMFDRLNESSVKTAKLFSQYFGKDINIWLRCIFVLTKANTYYFEDDDDDDEYVSTSQRDTMKMTKIMEDWSTDMKECLQKQGVPSKIIDDMPVCPAGTKKDIELPVTDNWIRHLLKACHDMVPPETKLVVMGIMKMRINGMKFGTEAGGKIGEFILGQYGYTIGSLIGEKLARLSCAVVEYSMKKNYYKKS